MLHFASSVRDPIYGAIPITSVEQEVMRLSILGRLKNIKQLGMAYIAFPGANHSRYEHSVGTMHVGSLMGQSVGLDDEQLQAVRLAALLHDVGHPPFSHSVEFAFRYAGRQEVSHSKVSMEKIQQDQNLKVILKKSLPLLRQEDISLIATGKFQNRVLSQIIDGPLDADKIDYILRDNYHCGFPVALDINTITEVFRTDGENIKLSETGMSFAEQLFVGRYHLITKIHHNKTNRLANYVLSLALNESLSKAKANEENSILKEMFNSWTDSDLLGHLGKTPSEYYPLLKRIMLGEEPLREECTFGYHDLSPYGRYNAAVISESIDRLPRICTQLGDRIHKDVFLDVYSASPPETTMSVDIQPPVFLIDAPLTRGAVDASLEQVYFSLYSKVAIRDDDLDHDSIITAYRKNLDSTLTKEKSEKILKQWTKSESERRNFYLSHLVETLANKQAIEIRKSKVYAPDVLLIVLHATYDYFLKTFRRRLYYDSTSQLAYTYLDLRTNRILGGGKEKLDPYPITAKGRNLEFPTNFLVDLERLERFGHVHRFSRAIKMGERFTQKNQWRITGWGRGNYQRNLSKIDSLRKLNDKIGDYLSAKVKPSKKLYKEYFELLEKAEYSREFERQAEAKRKDLPLKVSN